jgi:hypothetical protein
VAETAAAIACFALSVAATRLYLKSGGARFLVCFFGGFAAEAVFSAIVHAWVATAGSAGAMLGILAGWCWFRGSGRRAIRALGAKSWALLAGLVAGLQDAARPRPGLQPVPEVSR